MLPIEESWEACLEQCHGNEELLDRVLDSSLIGWEHLRMEMRLLTLGSGWKCEQLAWAFCTRS